MTPLLLGTTVFLLLMAGLFIPLEGWAYRRRRPEVEVWAVLLCVGLLFVDVVAMEWVGGALLDGLQTLSWRPPLPVWTRVVAVFLLAELAGYGVHRLAHRVPLLWRFHALHHRSEHLYWLEAWRQHPIDFVLHGVAVGVPGALLDASLADIGAVVLLRKTYTTFLHANLRWRLQGLGRWIATPAFHAVHHSPDPRDYDRNFAGMFPFLDRIFGTYRAPYTRGRDADSSP